MIITEEILDKYSACDEGMIWFESLNQPEIGLEELIERLMAENRFAWANWLLAHILNKKDRVRYAIFAAEQVLPIFESKYPNDLRPRKVIEAAKKYLKSESCDISYIVYSFVYEAAINEFNYDAVYAAYASHNAYNAAAHINYPSNVAALAAANAANNAAHATDYAGKVELKHNIINYGLKLTKGASYEY